ncbi:MAG: ATP-dependent 6-phosphofructokinase [Candidatus Eisenbacteria bacterium]|uniref:ATP-dependent 6-phosphofructokinase n=1 Tax=Eiseniibacteriota bacterium TaxID=2212470 RepID=A0A948RUN2_UNCEI|nr:ATP-dependent 6-phosphofructokinase [Candidatus Eisenbacteria bacterium]MBU1951114.1 ATP-dependent 6-phosphofructokinase [Candidatus Eisenbacteria bacterium]MBU2689792.1 ATP-dependent 6-phosphofructokinase [Candidatus Eisenbacteria bacterium]
MSRAKRIGVLTGGGDCPGLNAVIRGVVKAAVYKYDMDVLGFLDGYAGLLKDNFIRLDGDKVSGILPRGGTILGSSNRDNPFRVPEMENGELIFRDRSDEAIKTLERHGLDGLIVIGGDGSLAIASQLMGKGVMVIGVPKTIDNDLGSTDVTFGFDTALVTATEAVDKLHTTAESHHRIMVLEVMGRYAGWIALQSGLAGGGDIVLIPEIPFVIDRVIDAVRERTYRGRTFSIIVVAEGAIPAGGSAVVKQVVKESTDPVRLGGIGGWLANELEQRIEAEVRVTVLGHLQRGGSPTAFDRVLATRFGVAAGEAAVKEGWGIMVALRGTEIVNAPLGEAVSQLRRVDPNSELVMAARAVGTCFGD